MKLRFEKHAPSSPLASYVHQYYLFEGPNPGLINRIPAWTRPVLAIQWDATTTITVGGEARQSYAASMNGVITKPYELYTKACHYRFFSIEFTPIGLHALFGDQVIQLVDNSVDVFDMIPARKKWALAEAIGDAGEMGEKVKVIESFLIQFLPHELLKWNTRHVRYALAMMKANPRNINVREIAKTLQLSDRHLRRVFNEATGVSPKKYLRLLRFEQAFNNLLAKGYAPSLLTDQDYYDQAHFINEIREFAGVSPSKVDAKTYQFSKFFA